MNALRTRIPARLTSAILALQLLGLLALVVHAASHGAVVDGEANAETLQAECFVCVLGGVVSLPNTGPVVSHSLPEFVLEEGAPSAPQATARTHAVRARGPPVTV